jgi:hypothetical protein
MTPRNRTLTAACALAAALALATTAPAHASAGLSTATDALSNAGNLDLQLAYECDGGGTGSIAGGAAENLVVGVGSVSVACDGAQHAVSVPVIPVAGSFTTPGSATITAVLVDSGNVTVATLAPTGVAVF